MNHLAVAHEHRALERVLELADVAGPVIRHQHVDGGRGNPLNHLTVLARKLLEEVIGQQQHVRLPVAQRRHEDREDIEPVIEVLAEGPLRDRLLHVLVGRRDDADVDADGFGAAEPLELALLDDAEQLHLRTEVDVANLVEKDRPAFRQLEASLLARVRAGKRAFLVAKQLRLNQRIGQGRATHFHEGLLGSQRVVVNRMRNELFAGARLAANEHGGVGLRDLRDLLVHLPGGTAGADDVREVVALAQLLPQVGVLVDQPAPFFLDEPLDVERLGDHRADDAEELDAALVVALRLELEVDGECAGGGALDEDRHADEAQFVPRDVGAARHPVEKFRLLADARHDNRLAALDDLAGDAFANLVADRACAVVKPFNRLDMQLAVAQQRHHAAHDAVMANEDLQDPLHGRFQVERPR